MRIDALRAKLAEKKLSGLVVTDKTNRRYLCGFTGSNGLLLVTENKLTLFVDGRYTEQASQQTTGVEICEIPIGSHLIEVMRPFIAGMKVGFEAETISYQTFTELHFLMKEANGQLITTKNMVESLRMIKSSKEICALRQAAQIADQTLEWIMPMIRVGMTELDLANELDYRSKKLGSEGPAFETIFRRAYRVASCPC